MNDELLEIEELAKHFEGIKALDGFTCTVSQGEVLGLIGPNGAGKTTLFNAITCFVASDGGHIRFKGRELTTLKPHLVRVLGIARTFQEVRLIRQVSVIENMLAAFPNQPGENLLNLLIRPNICSHYVANNRKRALGWLEQAGLADKAEEPANNLSYGQQKLLALVCCLASDAELLLLDEPVAGVNPETINIILGMIRKLPEQGVTVVLIEHNIEAVMQVCDRVIFMDEGKKIAEGDPESVRHDPAVIEAYLE